MATVYDLKPKFQALLRPLLKPLRAVGFTPNGLTLLALLLSGAAGAAVATFAGNEPLWLLVLPAWLFLRMALNALDGMMAREMALTSPLGGFLNEAGDVVSDACLYLPFALVSPPGAAAVVVFVLLAALTELCGVTAQALGASRRYDGPMGKSDRAFWVGALALATALWPQVGRYWPLVFWALAALSALTCAVRVARALGELRRAPEAP